MVPAGETFTLVLASAAEPATLEAWLASAPPRGRAVYASGLDLPRAAPGVALVRRWQEAGLVELFRQRDPADQRRWQFLVEKAGVGVPGSPAQLGQQCTGCCANDTPTAALLEAGDPRTARQKAELLALLRTCGTMCPSNREIARQLGLGSDQRARNRARYLLDLLVSAGAIRLSGNGTNQPRTLVVLAGGEG